MPLSDLLSGTISRTLSDIYSVPSSEGLWGQAVVGLRDTPVDPVVDVLRVLGIVASIVFGALFIWALLKLSGYIKERAETKVENILNPPVPAQSIFDARWREITNHLGSFRDAEWKFAVIEADKIVDEILKQAGFPGDTLGERLTLMDKGQLQSLEDLWAAHKVRNLIAHDPTYQVRYQDAKLAIEQFEKALRELGVLA